MDAGGTPKRIRARHGTDEIGKLRAHRWPPGSPAPGLPGAEGAEALPVPANYGLGANDVERLSPPRPPAGKPHPKGTVEDPESRSRRATAEQGELLPERGVLPCQKQRES